MSNPNIPVTGPSTTDAGALEVRGGEAPSSFDELEALTAKGKGSKKAEKSEEKAEKSEKAEKVEKNEKSKDLTSDTDKGKKAEKKSEGDKGSKKAEGEKEQKEDAPPRKTIKAKYADSEIDVDEDAVVTVKINGKDETVAVKDLLSNYSGKTAWDKKFSELDRTRKDVSTKELKVKEIEAKVKEVFEEKDPQVRLFKMAEIAGVSPVQFRQQFLEENIKMLEKWYGMSEDERKADALAFENQYLKHQQETQTSRQKAEQAQKELQAKIEKIRAPHGISEEQFVQRYDELTQLVTAGKLPKEKMSPEFIVESLVKDSLWDAAASKLQELNLPWSEQERGQKLMNLVEKAYSIGIKPSDLPEMVDELWGSKKVQQKIEQKKAQKEEFISGKKPVEQTKPKRDEPTFFDDI